MTSVVETLQRPGLQSLVTLEPDGSTRFDIIVIPDRFKGPLDDIRKRIGGLSRVRSVQLDLRAGRFTVVVSSGGAEPRRIIGEVCGMGCVVRLLVPGVKALAA